MKVKVCAVGDLAPGSAARVVVGDVPVAVYNIEGSFYATSDTCSHEEASLSDGFIDEDIVECPKHGAMFHIPTGEVRSLPATRSVASFATTVEGDEVYVEVNDD
jgi:nitrite reductase/ring-hydroxylating ferredoxin subunit